VGGLGLAGEAEAAAKEVGQAPFRALYAEDADAAEWAFRVMESDGSTRGLVPPGLGCRGRGVLDRGWDGHVEPRAIRRVHGVVALAFLRDRGHVGSAKLLA
jgi:hypothetical protein